MIAAVAYALTACNTAPKAPTASATVPAAESEPAHVDLPSAEVPEPPKEKADAGKAPETSPAEPPPAEPPPAEPPPPETPPTGPPPAEPASTELPPTESPPAEPATETPKEEPKQAAPEAPSPQKPPGDETVLESTRRTVRWTTEWLAREVDSWFGDVPFEQGGEVKDGRLSLGFLKRQDESLESRLRFNARIRLPNLEQRGAYFYVGRANTTETVSDTPEALSRQQRLQTETPEDQSFFAGFGLSPLKTIDLRVGFHGIFPYAQARYRKPWTLTPIDLVEFRQTFFWQTSDRLGSTTALSYEHAVSSTFALRWLSAVTITQKTRHWDWSSSWGAYKTLGLDRLTSFELVTSGRLDSGIAVGEWGVQQKWLQPIYRDWLLGEFLVGYFWPREGLQFERLGRWAAGFTTTMRF